MCFYIYPRSMVRDTYKGPQLSRDSDIDTLLPRYGGRWRQFFRFQPRLRQNGVYIASCRYSRTGMHEENVWVNVIHVSTHAEDFEYSLTRRGSVFHQVIEFFRYFRFLPDGRCLALQCTEPPAEVVRTIEPRLQSKGFAIGSWQLHPDGLSDDHTCGRPPGPKVEVTSLLGESDGSRSASSEPLTDNVHSPSSR